MVRYYVRVNIARPKFELHIVIQFSIYELGTGYNNLIRNMSKGLRTDDNCTCTQWKVDVFVVWYDVCVVCLLPDPSYRISHACFLPVHRAAPHAVQGVRITWPGTWPVAPWLQAHTWTPNSLFTRWRNARASCHRPLIHYIHVCIHSCPKNPVIRSMNSKQVYMHTCIFILLKGARPRGDLIAWNKNCDLFMRRVVRLAKLS